MAQTARVMVALVALAAPILIPVSVSSAQAQPSQFDPTTSSDVDAGLLPAAPESAMAVPGDLLEYETAALARAELLHPYFEELSAMPGFESGGLAEGSDDLEFYWNGDLSPAAQAVLQRAEASGTAIRIVQTPYSYDEIWEHSLTLVRALENAGIEVGGFGPNRGCDVIELLSVDPATQNAAQAVAEELLPGDLTVSFIEDEGVGGVTFDMRHDKTGATPGE